MNSPEDKTEDRTEDQILENVIEKALGGTAKAFDFEAFKDRYPEQVKQYQAQVRLGKRPLAGRKVNFSIFAKLAVAAMLLVAVGVSLLDSNKHQEIPEVAVSPPPPSKISLVALNRAYRRGGLEAIDDQYEQAHAKLGPRTGSVTFSGLSNETL